MSKPPRSSPAVTQRYDGVQDTSLSHSDRSLRSMHSAPSLTNTGSTSFNSSVLSTSTNNLNVHTIPLPHNHSHDDENKENVGALLPPPDITVTATTGRPHLKRMHSERTVAESFRPSVQEEDPHTSWRVSEHGMLSDAYEDDEEGSSEYGSISNSTEELGRTLFYRPSTDPIRVRPESELDPELSAVLRSVSDTNLTEQSSSPTPQPSPLPPTRLPEPELDAELKTSPPIRPTRPASLDLSDTHEPALEPKRVDLRRHSRRSSRDRLSMLLGLGSSSSSPRASLQGGKPSLQPASGGTSEVVVGHARNQSYSSAYTTTSGSRYDKGKAPLVDTPEEPTEEWVHVGESVGTSSAVDLGRPRARTFSAHSRARTISTISREERAGVGEFSQDAAEMCRSVWEDDETESLELGRGWGLVRRWLGEEVGAGASTSTPARRHTPKALSLASTINAFRTPNMSPLFGEGGLMGTRKSPGPDASFGTANSRATPTPTPGPVPPRSATTGTAASRGSRISFQSFFTAESKQTGTVRSFVPEASTPTSAYASIAVPPSDTNSTSRHSSSFISARSSDDSGHEPESPTITAKRFRSDSRGGLEVPELPMKNSRGLFTQPGSSLGLEFEPGPSRSLLGVPSALPSPPTSPRDTSLASSQETAHATPRVPNTYVTPISPAPRHRPPIPRALASPTYASLHSRIGSPLRSGTVGEEGWAPMSPFISPSSPSPGWSPVSPFPRSSASPIPKSPISPHGSYGAGPSSPLPLGMDSTYRSDVRPISGWTESTYRPSVEGAWSKRDSATTAKRESDATFAGRHSFTHQPLLAPPRMKTVRIVETGNEDASGSRSEVMSVRAKREPRGPTLPTPPPSASRVGSIYKFRPGGPHTGPRMRVNRKAAVGAGLSPRAWFMMGFLLGPWCWLIGGWMTHYHAPMAVLDVEKSGARVFEGAGWVKRCRIASVVSGFVVFGGALVAVVWAVIGAR